MDETETETEPMPRYVIGVMTVRDKSTNFLGSSWYAYRVLEHCWYTVVYRDIDAAGRAVATAGRLRAPPECASSVYDESVLTSFLSAGSVIDALVRDEGVAAARWVLLVYFHDRALPFVLAGTAAQRNYQLCDMVRAGCLIIPALIDERGADLETLFHRLELADAFKV